MMKTVLIKKIELHTYEYIYKFIKKNFPNCNVSSEPLNDKNEYEYGEYICPICNKKDFACLMVLKDTKGFVKCMKSRGHVGANLTKDAEFVLKVATPLERLVERLNESKPC